MLSAIKEGIHVVAIDDSPHHRGQSTTEIFFVYCKSTFIEKVTHNAIRVDGLDATMTILQELQKEQENFSLILLHGITVGGMNFVDIDELSNILQKPILAVTENAPTENSINNAIEKLPDWKTRKAILTKAGVLEVFTTQHSPNPIFFHCIGMDPEVAKVFFTKFCIRSRLPEQLLLAHKIASSWK
ncbi:MAG: DUF99 family protein [Candidatus Lokiarchaeota archaeon]|nr:DUF99 family protein [Candidatus Lokiarchaeota archaeon]